MRPIQFTATALLALTPEQIAQRIAAVDSWNDFEGFGIVPGIRSARYEWSTDSMEGARVRVENRDGSSHVEEVIRWDVPRSIVMRMSGFSPPLRRLARYIQEEWTFEERPGGTQVRRTFALHPTSAAAGWLLRIVAWFLGRAVDRHLQRLGQGQQIHAPV